MDKYRIVEASYDDGRVRYILEKLNEVDGEWNSVYSHESLDEIREARKNRETRQAVLKRVVE